MLLHTTWASAYQLTPVRIARAYTTIRGRCPQPPLGFRCRWRWPLPLAAGAVRAAVQRTDNNMKSSIARNEGGGFQTVESRASGHLDTVNTLSLLPVPHQSLYQVGSLCACVVGSSRV